MSKIVSSYLSSLDGIKCTVGSKLLMYLDGLSRVILASHDDIQSNQDIRAAWLALHSLRKLLHFPFCLRVKEMTVV